MRVCEVCGGRGEVSAGVTRGRDIPGYTDDRGVTRAELVDVRKNPDAMDAKGEIWYLEWNSVHPGFGIAVCMRCHGRGTG